MDSFNSQIARHEAAGTGASFVCPVCLDSGRGERILGEGFGCAVCGTIFPIIDGVPVLLADATLRLAMERGDKAGDQRTEFYQEEAAYLRGQIRGGDDVRTALGTSQAAGLVLEIGSGMGVFAGIGGEDYRALDYSLSWLRTHLQAWPSLCASAENVPLKSGSCRYIFSFATLEHVPRPDKAFAEIDRLLAAGGVAYLAPAWHCRSWQADGLPVRPYSDLSARQEIHKAMIPILDSLAYRGAVHIPWRLARRMRARIGGPTTLAFGKLNANYDKFWMADSDAAR